jgi:N-ethylmaleimide reductase
MAPLTRNRATPSGAPTALNAQYYAQRASFGLIVTEGTQPSDDGQGYMLTPGIYTDEHIAAWRLVTDRVHDAGGRIFIQLMHAGRVAHPANTPHGRQPVAPSAVKPAAQMFTAQGRLDIPVPRALTVAEIGATIDDFRRAAAAAIAAGADGVEIHGANSYLIHQFLSVNANQRRDQYGGSLENRVRFAVDVARAVTAEIGADRTGLRISPGNTTNDIDEGDTAALYRTLVPALAAVGLAYLHVMHLGNDALLHEIRAAWPTTLIVNRAGRPREAIVGDVADRVADVASVGQMSLANPDLVARLRTGAPLNAPDPKTFFSGGAHGYTDYPTLHVA